jgi:hypothetical protein
LFWLFEKGQFREQWKKIKIFTWPMKRGFNPEVDARFAGCKKIPEIPNNS